MSRSPWLSRVVAGSVALTAVLVAAACTDSTGPSTDVSRLVGSNNSSKPSADVPGAADQGSKKTPPSFALVSTGIQKYPAYTTQTPGRITFASPSVYGTGSPNIRMVSVSGITAGDLPGILNTVQTYARIYAYLWRWNGSSWVQVDSKTDVALLPYPVKGSVALPSLGFTPQASGYYAVTIKITWFIWAWNDPVISQTFEFNAASDYLALKGATRGNAWIYLQ